MNTACSVGSNCDKSHSNVSLALQPTESQPASTDLNINCVPAGSKADHLADASAFGISCCELAEWITSLVVWFVIGVPKTPLRIFFKVLPLTSLNSISSSPIQIYPGLLSLIDPV